MQQADVVVYDRLVSAEILDLARRNSEKINYQAYKTWFEFDLKGRPQQNPSGALLK